MMPTRMIVVLLLLGLWGSSATPHRNGDRHQGRCADEPALAVKFAEVDANAGLFGVDDRFLLHETCDAGGRASEILVAPRHFFRDRHPEWEEPDSIVLMPWEEYANTLNRIRELRPLGQLESRGRLGFATNQRTTFLDQYERGLVKRDEYVSVDGGQQPPVAEFAVFFFRPISGTLQGKKKLRFPAGDREFRVNVDGLWYWARSSGFRSLPESGHVTLDLAGPIFELK
jgi:hypothetical protein